LAIEFPRVEGYVVDVKQRIRCDVDSVPPLHIEPQVEPTAVVVRTQMGWAVGKTGIQSTTGATETLTRERFYDEHRLQKTAFEIAREITEVLAGGKVTMGKQPKAERRVDSARLLFPQVLAAVNGYLEKRVTLAVTAHKEEVALARYRDIVVERLLTAIEPDTTEGEQALLPRIEKHRPIGSTAEVQFRTTKASKGTIKSHISHVVLDSPVWEGAAAWHLEQSPRVLAYARNDRLGFEIPYEWQDHSVPYVPDFLARVDLGGGRSATLIVEMKGMETEQDRAKTAAAQRWVRAVNNHGGFDLWGYLVCKDPNSVGQAVERWTNEQGVGAQQASRPAPR
jgi:type III restriction enzyme